MHRHVTRLSAKHELLEEPGGVRQVPLGWAGIGHRLQGGVFGAEASGQQTAAGAHRPKLCEQGLCRGRH